MPGCENYRKSLSHSCSRCQRLPLSIFISISISMAFGKFVTHMLLHRPHGVSFQSVCHKVHTHTRCQIIHSFSAKNSPTPQIGQANHLFRPHKMQFNTSNKLRRRFRRGFNKCRLLFERIKRSVGELHQHSVHRMPTILRSFDRRVSY